MSELAAFIIEEAHTEYDARRGGEGGMNKIPESII